MIHSILKKIFLCFGLISLITPQSLIRAEHNLSDLQPLCLTHNQLLEAQLLPLMHEIETSLDYWNTIEESPFSYAIIRGPNGWISSKTAQEDIADHQTILVQKQQELACALGELVQFSAHHTTQSQEEILAAIASCFHITDRLLTGNAVSDSMHTPEQLITQGTQAIERLTTFSTQYSTQLEPHIKPNHFIRHWTKYAAGAGSLLVAALYAYTHQEKLHTWHTKGQDALFNFWKTHIKTPIQNTKDILFGRKHINVISKEAVDGSRNAFHSKLSELLPIIKPEASPAQVRDLATYIMNSKDSQLLVDFWGKQAKHLIWNTVTNPVAGNLHFLEINALLIQLKDWQLNEATFAGQQAWEAQQLNAEIAAIFPVVLALYGAKKTYDGLFQSKILAEPMQHRLLLIDKLLNNNGNNPLTREAVGHLHYQAFVLAQYVNRIPRSQQKSFITDIEELNNPAFSVAQKMRVIDQMYRQYSFLHALPV